MAAQDAVISDGPLTQEAFYRLVACAAPQDQPCAKPFYHWQSREITVGIVQRDKPFLGGKIKRAEAAVVRALQHLNAVDMGVSLRQTADDPDIAIHLLDVARSETINLGPDHLLHGLRMANAITALDVEGSRIIGASIALSRTMTIRQYESVMLEEITQALGLLTDIENPYYQSRSIFSQNADNSLKTLGEQDKLALIRHYPPH
ncbi:DUF2927 domain-containing protein [Sulfitobacter donghicola]|uniref:Uncharacterized protein n=1 Tax=Sulfitobacter donghicola DSW-25 = KCTC 12864 = JCM 14565 TaxID=1300350 RepID=A0A073IET6_9RHOB|nr:DUF2927 domain-containing protein [Sulfitobacter donghicola]KEJ88279.1 hypothetical protein DSW25_16520 [Sulfitobacter donghicola DSW-25 = KCTC 12864 = JCM 14565]KIN68873.1 hypothetical protein Z948_2605 [Sulfitobacter donghicola DSW-25 = KCTC 12864 = JCM 14565]